MSQQTFFSLAVVRCPETYRHIAEHLGPSLFIGKRSRLCDMGKQLRFQTRAEANEWVAAFYGRGNNKKRYGLEVLELREDVDQVGARTVTHTTVFAPELE